MHGEIPGHAPYNLGVRGMSNDGSASNSQSREDIRVFTISVRSLVEVHEIHIDGIPGDLNIGLNCHVQQGLRENLHPPNPHFCGAEGIHPGDDAQHLIAR